MGWEHLGRGSTTSHPEGFARVLGDNERAFSEEGVARTRPSTALAGDPDRPNLDRPQVPYAGDTRFRFGPCASLKPPRHRAPLRRNRGSLRTQRSGDCGGAAPTSRPPVAPFGAARGHGPTRRSGTPGSSAGTADYLADQIVPCSPRAGSRPGVRADTEDQPLPPRIRFAASVRFFTPSAL